MWNKRNKEEKNEVRQIWHLEIFYHRMISNLKKVNYNMMSEICLFQFPKYFLW